MTDVYIGAGGWAYFQVPNEDPLVAYSRVFSFVEVNSTFYAYPSVAAVSAWRSGVPKDFRFAVKAHSDLSHRYGLRPVQGAFRSFDRMKRLCRLLRTKLLVIETPADALFGQEEVRWAKAFFASVNLKRLRLVWEIRSAVNRSLEPSLARLMEDLGIVHCVDISREAPQTRSEMLYSRLFGRGQHNVYQFDDDELKAVDKKAVSGEFKQSILAFHSVKMYADAARLKAFRETGRFPEVTRSTGAESLLEVLKEDATFPATRDRLLQSQGWKVIDLTPERRVHASELLRQLPQRTYLGADEVYRALVAEPLL